LKQKKTVPAGYFVQSKNQQGADDIKIKIHVENCLCVGCLLIGTFFMGAEL
jgi:hypothetical protein